MSSKKLSVITLEDRVKSMVSSRMTNPAFKKQLKSNEIVVMDKMFNLLIDTLHLQENSDKDAISGCSVNQTYDDIVLTEFPYENEMYYVDKAGGLWDKDANIIGTVKKVNESNVPVFFQPRKPLIMSKNINDYIT